MMQRRLFTYSYMAVTLAIAAIIFLILRFEWYPDQYYSIFSVWKTFLQLVVALLVVGPLFSFFAYKDDQNSMLKDLVVIVMLQMFVLTIGVYKLYEVRPLFLVFSVDRFVVVSANSINRKSISPLIQLELSLGKTPMLVAAHLPSNPDVSFMMAVLGGAPDIELRPELYEPALYQLGKIKERGYAIGLMQAKLPSLAANTEQLEKYIDEPSVLGYPLVNSNFQDMIILVDIDELDPVDVINISPWELLERT